MMSDPNQGVVQAIIAELRDTNKEKRRTAVMKLGMLGGDQAIRVLIRILDNHYEDLIVRGRAAMMLGRIGDERAIQPLIRALDAPGYQTPLYAVEALGLLGDERAIPALVHIVETSRDRLQKTAEEALIRLGYVLIDEDSYPLAEPEPEL